MNSNIANSLKVAGISIAVAIIGGIIQALSNFHPADQYTALILTVFGGGVIGGLNHLMHILQGTTIAPVNTTVQTTTVTTPATSTTTTTETPNKGD
jgi:hypothetical protein